MEPSACNCLFQFQLLQALAVALQGVALVWTGLKIVLLQGMAPGRISAVWAFAFEVNS